MKTYEDFLVFLEEHLNHMSDFIPVSDRDFHPVCFAIARFLLAEPYRWENLLATWPQLPGVAKPLETELINFFKNQKGLPHSFRKELAEHNLETLYQAYNLLYPALIVKDDFLRSVFREDLLARKYKTLFRESDKKIKRVTEKINQLKNNTDFHPLMQRFTKDLSGFSLTLINNWKLLDQAVGKLMNR